jgi:hypothetical protein
LARGTAHEHMIDTFEADVVYAGWLWWNSLQHHTVTAFWNSCCVMMLVLTSLESIKLLSEHGPDHLLFGSFIWISRSVAVLVSVLVQSARLMIKIERNCEVWLPCVKVSVIHGMSMLISPGFIWETLISLYFSFTLHMLYVLYVISVLLRLFYL